MDALISEQGQKCSKHLGQATFRPSNICAKRAFQINRITSFDTEQNAQKLDFTLLGTAHLLGHKLC